MAEAEAMPFVKSLFPICLKPSRTRYSKIGQRP
jgi:hypothetical protein